MPELTIEVIVGIIANIDFWFKVYKIEANKQGIKFIIAGLKVGNADCILRLN